MLLCSEKPEQCNGPVSQRPRDYRTFVAAKGPRTALQQKSSENGVPHDTFSQSSLNCMHRTSSWQFRSHSFLRSAVQGGSEERRPRWWASALPSSWRSSSWACNCNAWHHRWACPGQLQETHALGNQVHDWGINAQHAFWEQGGEILWGQPQPRDWPYSWDLNYYPQSQRWVWGSYAQSCPTLCDPVDCSPPGSSVCGIF